MNNVTMVLPQDSEMSYVTYMFTLYNSPLPGLRAQTQFYSDVLHMSMLQVCQHSAFAGSAQQHGKQRHVPATLAALLSKLRQWWDPSRPPHHIRAQSPPAAGLSTRLSACAVLTRRTGLCRCLQFRPGPGTQAITVTHLYSWYHRWGDVVLTTQPQVAQRLPLPSQPVPVLTSSTRASPLVQAVLTGDQLQVR